MQLQDQYTSLQPSDGFEDHLAEILASPPFRSSGRSQQFLKYVVRESLSGHHENLKERAIGEIVFGRPADYDTGQDSIVRVKANEVRRRLSQFYEQNPALPLRFEMSAGSYAIQIRQLDSPAPTTETPSTKEILASPSGRSKWWIGALAASVSLVAVAGYALAPTAASQYDRFWRPFLQGSKPLLICVPNPQAYRIYGADTTALVEAFKPRSPNEVAADPPVNVSLRDVRIIPEPGMLMGIGDAHLVTALGVLSSSKGKEYTSRLSSMTTFADLSAGPSIVVGAETKQWHSDLVKGSRYNVTKVGGKNVVYDEQTRDSVCTKPNSWESPATYDCAVVTLLRKSSVGHALMLASGLDHFGTYTLGDFLTSPKRLGAALESAPHGWEEKNIQIVVRAERLRDGVGPPRVIATHVW